LVTYLALFALFALSVTSEVGWDWVAALDGSNSVGSLDWDGNGHGAVERC
jgi:hypothetical protein